MSRHTKRVTIAAPGRDFGKVFELNEMPSDQGERWATRAIIALANAGAKLPEGVLNRPSMAGLELSWRNVFVTGIQALQGVREADVRPLLDEMKLLVTWCPPAPAGVQMPTQPIFSGEQSQVEEIATWYFLYGEVLELHLGFSLAAMLSTTDSAPEAPSAS